MTFKTSKSAVKCKTYSKKFLCRNSHQTHPKLHNHLNKMTEKFQKSWHSEGSTVWAYTNPLTLTALLFFVLIFHTFHPILWLLFTLFHPSLAVGGSKKKKWKCLTLHITIINDNHFLYGFHLSLIFFLLVYLLYFHANAAVAAGWCRKNWKVFCYLLLDECSQCRIHVVYLFENDISSRVFFIYFLTFAVQINEFLRRSKRKMFQRFLRGLL